MNMSHDPFTLTYSSNLKKSKDGAGPLKEIRGVSLNQRLEHGMMGGAAPEQRISGTTDH